MRFRLGFTVSEYDDESLLFARRAFREYVILILEPKFGVKRQSLQIVHLEVWHASMGPRGLFLHQGLTWPSQPAKCQVSRLQLAWICQTRMDLDVRYQGHHRPLDVQYQGHIVVWMCVLCSRKLGAQASSGRQFIQWTTPCTSSRHSSVCRSGRC